MKGNSNSLISLTWLYSQVTTFMYLQYSHVPLFITFCQMFARSHTPSVRPSLFVFHTDCLIAQISSSLVLYQVSHSGSFTGEEIVIAWTHIGQVWWMFQNFPLPVVRNSSSGVTPCFVMKNDRVLYQQVLYIVISGEYCGCSRISHYQQHKRSMTAVVV